MMFPQVRIECLNIDPDSAGQAAHVLRLLRDVHELPPKQEMECLQGYVRALKARGWGVILHMADAESLRLQVLQIARKRYYGVQRKMSALALTYACFIPLCLAHNYLSTPLPS